MSVVNTSTKTNGPAGLKSNFPVDFSLYDKNLHYVLYITDDPTKEHRLTLELDNNSNQKISFDSLPGPTSERNCNFELRLRNGTLSDQTLKILRKDSTDTEISKLSVLSKEDQNDWDIHLDEGSSGTNAYVSLYFRSLRNEAVSLAPDSVMILDLEHISADAGSGARGTRVEFIPHLIRFSDDNTLVTGNREQHLFITNHSGQKHIPLHVGFVGSDRVLSEGANQKLTVRITNVAGNQDLNLIPSSFDSPTFVIEFDYHADWGFGAPDEIKTIEIAAKDGWKADRRGLLWNIYHPNPPALKPDAYIEFDINHITTSGSSGFALLYLYYQHIAGYWDGHFVLTAEKTPLMFSGNNVGIGIKDPTIRLALGDNDTGLDQKGDGKLTFLTNGSERARIDENGNVGIGTAKPGGTLDLQKVGTDKRQADLISNAFPYGAETADLVLTHEISKDYSLNGQSAALIDFRAVYSWPGGQAKWSTAQILGVSDLNTKGYAGGLAFLTSPGGSDNPSSRNQNDTRNNGAAPITRMVIDAKGNIGIGTISPQAKLNVINAEQDANGNTLILGPTDKSNLRLGYHTDYSWIQSHGSKPLAINPIGNNVGIGTNNPSVKLEVNGRIKDQSGYVMPVGTIASYAGSVAPEGWLICDGQTVPPDEKYKNLRDLIGNITPNLSGKVLVGAGGKYSLHQAGGEEAHILTVAEMPSHSHNYDKFPGNRGGIASGDYWTSAGASTGAAGGNQPHNNMQPYYVVNYIIKY
jgi:microcystin-dependent protein